MHDCILQLTVSTFSKRVRNVKGVRLQKPSKQYHECYCATSTLLGKGSFGCSWSFLVVYRDFASRCRYVAEIRAPRNEALTSC